MKSTVLGLVKDRSGEPSSVLRTLNSPLHLTAILIHRHKERAAFLIAYHEHLVVSQYGRGAQPKRIVEGPQREFPSFLPIRSEGNQPKISKKSVNIGPVSHGAGRSRTVGLVQFLGPVTGYFTFPANLSAGPIQTDDQKPLAFKGCHEDPVIGEYRRGVTRRKGRLPDDILVWAKLGGQVHVI